MFDRDRRGWRRWLGRVPAVAAGLGLAACASSAPPVSSHAVPATLRPVAATTSTPVPPTPSAPAPSPSPTPSKLELALKAAQQRQVLAPAQLAARIELAEDGIRSALTPSSRLPQLGALEQAAYIQLVARPDWQQSVLASLQERLRPIAQANLSAGTELAALNSPVPELPHWQVQPPPPAQDLLNYYQQAQQVYGVAWQYLAAINLVETSMGRIHGLSSAGAQGPMQFLPQTWAHYGQGDVNNARDAIPAAARYLKAHGAPQDMNGAVYAYNPSDHYVRAVTLYTQQMQSSASAFYGYYNWQVYVSTTSGLAFLSGGFSN